MKNRGIRSPSDRLVAGVVTPKLGVPPCWRGIEMCGFICFWDGLAAGVRIVTLARAGGCVECGWMQATLQICTIAGFGGNVKRVCRLDFLDFLDFLAGRKWFLYLVNSNLRKSYSTYHDLSLLHTRVSLPLTSTSQTCPFQRKTAFVLLPRIFSPSISIRCAVEIHFSLLIIQPFFPTDPPRAQKRRRSGYTCTCQAER